MPSAPNPLCRLVWCTDNRSRHKIFEVFVTRLAHPVKIEVAVEEKCLAEFVPGGCYLSIWSDVLPRSISDWGLRIAQNCVVAPQAWKYLSYQWKEVAWVCNFRTLDMTCDLHDNQPIKSLLEPVLRHSLCFLPTVFPKTQEEQPIHLDLSRLQCCARNLPHICHGWYWSRSWFRTHSLERG